MIDPLELLMVADTMIGAGRAVCEVSGFHPGLCNSFDALTPSCLQIARGVTHCLT